jgi:formamidopyrimidine-DNA glycosylase
MGQQGKIIVPEGPEVETIRRGLELGIVGQTVASIETLWQKSFDVPNVFVDQYVFGAKVSHLDRRGKVLVIDLSSKYSLLVHLKMTGQLVLVKDDGERFAGGHPTISMRDALPDSSTKVIFSFESGDRLFFNDFRKFGWIKLVPTDEVELDALVARLGPEALGESFTPEYFKTQILRHKRALIKPTILDQSTVAGIGNIYADESLHLAKIHPKRLAGQLSAAEIKRLYAAIRTIIALGIEHGGTSFSQYVNALGGKGDYLEHARVFRREGLACPLHENVSIEKIRVAGRGTHFCPKCQQL